MNRGNLIIDVDGVIADCVPSMLAMLNRRTGGHVEMGDIHAYDAIPKLYGMSGRDFVGLLADESGWLENMDPLPGAREALCQMRGDGYRVLLATARGYRDDAEAITRAWLRRHEMPFDHLLLVPAGSSKSDVYRHYGDRFEAIFDDNPGDLSDARDSGMVRATFCIDYAWNREFSDPVEGYRAPSLHAAAQMLDFVGINRPKNRVSVVDQAFPGPF